MDEALPEVLPELNELARVAVNAVYTVHKALGPGLLESVYEACLAQELKSSGLSVLRQVVLPIRYAGVELDEGFRLDILVERQLIIEVKAAAEMHPVFAAQMLTYLRLSQLRLGLLVNFNTPLIRDGIKRILNPQCV